VISRVPVRYESTGADEITQVTIRSDAPEFTIDVEIVS
jgi:hypothetical protein